MSRYALYVAFKRGITLILALWLIGCVESTNQGDAMQRVKILVLGQSNAACYGEKAYKAESRRVFAEYEDQRVRYADPVRGCGTHEWGQGSIWGLVGDHLAASSNQYFEIVFTVIAKGGTSAQHWDRVNDGLLNPVAEHAASAELDRILQHTLLSGAAWTHVIWQQGETDGLLDTPPEEYTATMGRIIDHIRAYTAAPIYIALTSQCFEGVKQNVRTGQFNAVVENEYRNVHFGADLDLRVPDTERQFMGDSCHLSWTGQQLAAQAWYEVLFNP